MLFRSIVLEPIGCGRERPGVEPAARDAAVPSAPHEPRPLEYAQVLGNGGARNGERLGQRADRRLAVGEPGQDGPAGMVPERGVDRVEAGKTGNHMVTIIPGKNGLSRPEAVEYRIEQRVAKLEARHRSSVVELSIRKDRKSVV